MIILHLYAAQPQDASFRCGKLHTISDRAEELTDIRMMDTKTVDDNSSYWNESTIGRKHDT
jgi:hypothetical protein